MMCMYAMHMQITVKYAMDNTSVYLYTSMAKFEIHESISFPRQLVSMAEAVKGGIIRAFLRCKYEW